MRCVVTAQEAGPTLLDPTEEEVCEMAATTFTEQDTGTWSRHLHHYNGYSSGFSTPGNGVLRTSRKISRPALASANTLSANRQGMVGHSHGAAA